MEKLPGQMVNGIDAEGSRTTCVRLGPANNGSRSNVSDVQETWVSPELKIVVRSKFTSTYPGSSATITEMVRLDRNEPDPALFEIPADYAVEEMSMVPR